MTTTVEYARNLVSATEALLNQRANVNRDWATYGPSIFRDFGEQPAKVLATEAGFSEDKARILLATCQITAMKVREGEEAPDYTEVYSLFVKAHKSGAFKDARTAVNATSFAHTALKGVREALGVKAKAKAAGAASTAEFKEAQAQQRKEAKDQAIAAKTDAMWLAEAMVALKMLKGDGSITTEQVEEAISMLTGALVVEAPSVLV